MSGIEKTCTEIQAYFKNAGKPKAVLGLSGGVDSAVTAFLIVRALGEDKVVAVLLPNSITQKQDMEDAREIARKLKIKLLEVDLEQTLVVMEKVLGEMTDLQRGNLTARLRMAVLYQIASKNNALVVGTGNKSEISIGYFTKYGDGGCDLLPIGSLYKSQIMEIAEELGIPEKIIRKPPSAGFWKEQSDEGEIGMSYGELDKILEQIEKGKLLETTDFRKVREMVEKSEHKRRMPKIL